MPPRRRYDHHPLRERVDRLPQAPGVYLMKDAAGKILYVGKAVNLRARVRSYFNGTDGRRRMHQLMRELVQLEVSLAADEREALLLEARLIRQHQPKYNIALKGSARPDCLRLDLRQPYPRLERGPREDDGAHYFGPLPSKWHASQMHALLERLYPLRTCDDQEMRRARRPCLQYQLKRCLGPCVGHITPEAYRAMLERVMAALDGGEEELARQLREAMGEAAERLEFEQAALLRDRLRAVEGLRQKQPPPVAGNDRDVIGLHRVADEVAIAVIPVRWGRQQQVRLFYFEGQLAEDAEILTTFLLQHYQRSGDLPLELILPFDLPDREAVGSILLERAERPFKVSLPPDAASLEEVAQQAAKAELDGVRDETDRAARGAEALARALGLKTAPKVIEWLHLDPKGGEAHCLRLVDGELEAGSGRGYKLRPGMAMPVGGLERVIRRRQASPAPDLLVLEGGRAMLQAASSVVQGTAWEGVALLAFSVERQTGAADAHDPGAADGAADPAPDTAPEAARVYLPGRRNPLRLPPHSPARRLLQRLRDEGWEVR